MKNSEKVFLELIKEINNETSTIDKDSTIKHFFTGGFTKEYEQDSISLHIIYKKQEVYSRKYIELDGDRTKDRMFSDALKDIFKKGILSK